MVGTEGLEPSRDYSHTLLKRTRMPIPPRALFLNPFGINIPLVDVFKALGRCVKSLGRQAFDIFGNSVNVVGAVKENRR